MAAALPPDAPILLITACAEATRRVYDLGGGAAVFLDSPLQRRFRDAHVIPHHIMVSAQIFELAGRVLLGQPTREDQL